MKETIECRFERQAKILNKPFVPAVHAENFEGWCEVLILANGVVCYAMPSHEERMIRIWAMKNKMSVRSAKKKLAGDPDWIKRVMKEIGCAFVWYDSVYSVDKLTPKQLASLGKLIASNCVSDEILNSIRSI